MSKLGSSSLKKSLYTLVTLVTTLVVPSYVMGVINVRMQTDFGAIDIELLDTVAPNTVANFLNYVNDRDYEGTFFHRSIPGFVLQGGGFIFNPANGAFAGSGVSGIPVDPPVVNEFNLSNVRGTLAMAKGGGDPDSARSEFFFNLVDNSENLDNQNGGFTVFARVLGNGMDIIDEITALPVCKNSVPQLVRPTVCGDFLDVTALNFFDTVTNTSLINLNHIGLDNDSDGAIDGQEDRAPNNGDGNNDTVLDSTQQHVASFPGESGGFITLEAAASSLLQSMNVLRTTYRLTTPDPDGIFNNREFTHGFFDYDISNITPGDNQVTMTVPVILPDECSVRDSYFNFGPTTDNMTPHWYEFTFDGVTGAEVIGNMIMLHYVDGLRGDSDVQVNGIINVSTGGPTTGDGDGISGTIEAAGPNNGDGNNDGIIDCIQGDVTSLVDSASGDYVTVEAPPSSQMESFVFTDADDFQDQPGSELLNNIDFANGLLSFDVRNITSGSSTAIILALPDNESPTICSVQDSYFNFGPTPDDAIPHWYEFNFDGVTGAEAIGDTVMLRYVDGLRGDSDLAENGVISVTSGGLATVAGDSDGISDMIENAGPNNGDGNDDGILDCVQDNVASLVDAFSGGYVTVAAPPVSQLDTLAISDGVDLLNIINQPDSAGLVSGLNFTHGFINFNVNNITPGGNIDITLTLPEEETPVTYFKFGPTSDNPVDHLYNFNFDGETGAEFNGNRVTLHFVDGKRGDSDLLENGVITDPGTPAQAAPSSSSGGSSGSGCSMRADARLQSAGDWWLLLMLISLLGCRLKSRKRFAQGSTG